jgi:two-component system, response regulator FlrC
MTIQVVDCHAPVETCALSRHQADPAQETDEEVNLVGRTVDEVERTLILQTLAHCNGNRSHAAKALGISVRTLRNKIHIFRDAGLFIPGRRAAM